MLPSLSELEKVSNKIKNIPNKQGEYKRKIHYCCYLLGYKSGLRISEAISLDLSNKTQKDLYSVKTKGKKERFVFISKEVIKELKTNNWKPNQTNRWTFYQFLKKVKKELNISKNTELSPHTLRRAFTTYHANSGMPLPLLQKLLGHKSIRTTALYWQDTGDGDDDLADILAGKKWLENKKEPPKSPSAENFPAIAKSPEPVIIQKPVIKDNFPTPSKTESKATNYQPKIVKPKIFTPNKSLISEIPPKTLENFSCPEKISFSKENFSLNDKPLTIREQLPLITSRGEQPNEKQSFVGDQKEKFLLAKIKQLEEQLKQKQEETKFLEAQNNNLRIKLAKSENEKNQERARTNHYQKQLKTIAKAFNQWQKINYYQQLEKERQELEAKIIQSPPSK